MTLSFFKMLVVKKLSYLPHFHQMGSSEYVLEFFFTNKLLSWCVLVLRHTCGRWPAVWRRSLLGLSTRSTSSLETCRTSTSFTTSESPDELFSSVLLSTPAPAENHVDGLFLFFFFLKRFIIILSLLAQHLPEGVGEIWAASRGRWTLFCNMGKTAFTYSVMPSALRFSLSGFKVWESSCIPNFSDITRRHVLYFQGWQVSDVRQLL